MKWRVSFVPFALTLVACGNADQSNPTAWVASIDTLGDTVVVRTVTGSVWGDTADLVPEVRIGVLDGPDEYMFGSVQSLAVSESGGIYVLDSQVPAMRKYAPDGTYSKTLGREGGGPGEYKQPAVSLFYQTAAWYSETLVTQGSTCTRRMESTQTAGVCREAAHSAQTSGCTWTRPAACTHSCYWRPVLHRGTGHTGWGGTPPRVSILIRCPCPFGITTSPSSGVNTRTTAVRAASRSHRLRRGRSALTAISSEVWRLTTTSYSFGL